MNVPTFDEVQAPNLRAANEHLRRQVAHIPGLLRRIAELEAELRAARTVLESTTVERSGHGWRRKPAAIG